MTRLAELIARQQPGFSLERSLYTDPAIFALDMERVYLRQWLFAGHVSRIPRPGDYFLHTIAGESIILIRRPDESVRALFNVCRHRGSQLCLQESGTAKKLVCPYHAWVYETDGRLIAARHMPDDFDKRAYGLHTAHVRVVEGLIFVCLAEEAPAFDQVADDLTAFFAPHRLAEGQICHRECHTTHANWKLVLENFWECYHCGPTHPEFCSVMSYAHAYDSQRLARERNQLEAAWSEQAQQLGHLTGRRDRFAEGGHHFVTRTPIRPGYLTQSEGGQPVAPLMGDFEVYDGGITAFMGYPMNWFVACNDHAMLSRFTPISAQETEMEFTWLVRADATEGVDYDPLAVSWLWRTTAEQDKTICENNQKGVNSRRYQPGPYSTIETSTSDFVAWYLEQLRSDAHAHEHTTGCG
jgi:phenylpropionate dioxygenase-like ring-hydroxylating dioxygenase large terminal subunit